MENLKLETLTDLKMHGKTAEDVRWVGTRGRKIPLDVFWEEADWLERHEYDGAEWWEYKEHPSQPLITDTEDPLHLIFAESFFW